MKNRNVEAKRLEKDMERQAEELAGVESPWIYSYWAEGLKQVTIPLQEQGAEPATCDVRSNYLKPLLYLSAASPTSFCCLILATSSSLMGLH